MEIKLSETKKGKKTVIEYWEFPSIKTIINYILFLFIWSIFTTLFLSFLLINEGLETYNKLFMILFLSVFLILGVKQSYGNFYIIYKVLLKKEWLAGLLGELHGIFILIYFFLAIFSKGKILLGFLLNLSVILFVLGLCLAMYLFFNQNLKGGKE
jgi:hypothetical protein